MRAACDHERSTCSESEPDPFIKCDDKNPCTQTTHLHRERCVLERAPLYGGRPGCTSGMCNPETGECEHDIAEGYTS